MYYKLTFFLFQLLIFLVLNTKGQSHELHVSLSSTKQGNISLYYLESQPPYNVKFNERHRLNQKINVGDNKIIFRLPENVVLQAFRLDFGGENFYEINEIIYINKEDSVLISPTVLATFGVFNKWIEWDLCENHLSLSTIPGDPYLVFTFRSINSLHQNVVESGSWFYINPISTKDFVFSVYYKFEGDTNKWFSDVKKVTMLVYDNQIKPLFLNIPDSGKIRYLRLDFGSKTNNDVLIKEMAVFSQGDIKTWSASQIINEFYPNSWVKISTFNIGEKSTVLLNVINHEGYPDPLIYSTNSIIYNREYKLKRFRKTSLIIVAVLLLFMLNRNLFNNFKFINA